MNAAARDESLGSVEMSDGLTGGEVAGALAQVRVDLGHEVPAIARLYLTPVERRGMRQHPG